MNILLVTLAYPESETQTNLYTDLMSEFKKNGHDVTVVCQREKEVINQRNWYHIDQYQY